MRIVIAGGGTGGHLYPGIALAEEMIRREPDTEVIFIGTERGIEAKVIPREGFIIKFIPSEGFVGKSTIKKARSVYLFLKGLKESYRYLEEIKPDIVVGSGGYASFAPLVGAWLLSIPTLILEQNTVPGRANRILGHIAKLICITYQESMARFPRSKVYLTGNPVRGRLLKGSRTSALRLFSLRKDLFTVFVFGGSSGASAINRAEVDALQHMLEFKDRIQFLHQTGEKDFEFVRDSYRSYGFKGTVAPYIFQMPEAYAIADLVISRAGATTIAEVCATG
ncbi:MAG TPA: undecaprenyldiphospho-muramoylpentapeptide beta-N-acetylglucosaminyltransferase, partial [Nitrospirae bacterium]|nr:undecaprenyldiphospho-muramoylpentapeptide beta-N-acetylglucosaminyltransferase [Nitrospirota bacterium]